MWKRRKIKNGAKIFLFVLCIAGVFPLFFRKERAVEIRETPKEFPVEITIDELPLPETARAGERVGAFLERVGVSFSDRDFLFPSQDVLLAPSDRILLDSAKKYTLATQEKKMNGVTTLHTVRQLLGELGIAIGENDLVTPDPEKAVSDGVRIAVVHVDIRMEIVQKPLPFETEETDDEHLSWRKRIVTQKGEQGIRELTYKVISHDGKEIKRTLSDSRTVKEPVSEVVTQGTKVVVGKTHTGLGSWYSFTGTLSAANPWLPIGSFVRVTNTDNGKSVIVRINDRGPFGKNRIIDLDKVAFQKIASLGAGIISVKVEEITN